VLILFQLVSLSLYNINCLKCQPTLLDNSGQPSSEHVLSSSSYYGESWKTFVINQLSVIHDAYTFYNDGLPDALTLCCELLEDEEGEFADYVTVGNPFLLK